MTTDMNVIEGVIWEATENGGWKPGRNYRASDWATVTSNKDFWIALGKARGWSEKMQNDCPTCGYDGGRSNSYGTCLKDWEYWMIAFMRHLAEGKDAESFFKELV